MAEKRNGGLTVFQRLGQILGPDGVNTTKQNSNKYNIKNTELLRTTSKEEYQAAKLQAQQNAYVSAMWHKGGGEMRQQALQYETTRIASYVDFENMEYFPEMAAALDIMSEEATTPNDKGKVMNIYSESTRIKDILEDLFFNRLDIHTNLHMWARNVCKFGDNFCFLNVDQNDGVIGVRQLPNIEIERHEGDLYDSLAQRNMVSSSKSANKSNYDSVKFIWKGRDLEFNSWQIAHFRLLSDDKRLPYGTSVLEKARRIWKQLLLSEDSMLVYRVTRAPERKVYKIYVGNIDDVDVPAYVNEIANRFKRTPLIDPQTGQIDLRYNQIGQDQDYFIPVREEGAPNPIDILPGASNLNDIADIEFLQKKLFTALRVPKAFLGFEETTGEGKNLALQDIRFSRTINRIQQSLLQELNKIAIIHLYLLGFEDDLTNFSLTLNNPSTQAEMLKIEHLQQKISLYGEAVRDAGNGFAAMSMTRAKKDILGMSEDEIKQDLLEQRIEKAAAAELEQTAQAIKHTGFFDKVDNIYGDPNYDPYTAGGDVEGEEGGDKGGFGGGGGLGGGDIDFGEEGDEAAAEEGVEFEGGDEGLESDFEEGAEAAEEFEGATVENIQRAKKVLAEQKKILIEKQKKRAQINKQKYINRLVENLNITGEEESTGIDIHNKNLKINENIDSMIKGIDDIIEE